MIQKGIWRQFEQSITTVVYSNCGMSLGDGPNAMTY